MKIQAKILLLTLLGVASPLIAGTQPSDENTAAKWQHHQIKFQYAGFTSDYSCEGARYKVKLLLRAIGARDDARVDATCSGRSGEAQPFQNLRLAFAVPVPADARDINEETFPASWKKLRLSSKHPRELDAGDCELVEQFSRQVLSRLDVRELDDKSSCVPHQHNLGSPDLRLTVLTRQQAEPLETTQ